MKIEIKVQVDNKMSETKVELVAKTDENNGDVGY